MKQEILNLTGMDFKEKVVDPANWSLFYFIFPEYWEVKSSGIRVGGGVRA